MVCFSYNLPNKSSGPVLHHRAQHVLIAAEILLADIFQADQIEVQPLLFRDDHDMGEHHPEIEFVPLLQRLHGPVLGEDMDPVLGHHKSPGLSIERGGREPGRLQHVLHPAAGLVLVDAQPAHGLPLRLRDPAGQRAGGLAEGQKDHQFLPSPGHFLFFQVRGAQEAASQTARHKKERELFPQVSRVHQRAVPLFGINAQIIRRADLEQSAHRMLSVGIVDDPDLGLDPGIKGRRLAVKCADFSEQILLHGLHAEFADALSGKNGLVQIHFHPFPALIGAGSVNVTILLLF